MGNTIKNQRARPFFTLNGESRPCAGPLTPASLIEELGLPLQALVVELNGAIVKKENYALVAIKPGDQVEIIRFVGGG